jgi:hypothetical protein
MTKQQVGTTKLSELPIGWFASVNGTVIYRHGNYDGITVSWPWDKIYTIEKHKSRSIADAFHFIDDLGFVDFMCETIAVPEKKHVDQAINLLTKDVKEGKINGLTYVDNYVMLKEYLKIYAIKRS